MKGMVARICTSFIDVPGKIAVAVYFSGCSIRCPGCQNRDLWDKNVGAEITSGEVVKRVKEHTLAESAVFLGGEPTDQLDFLIAICMELSLFKMVYTGREFEDLSKELLDNIDMVVCGPFKIDRYVEGAFPASSNQRVFQKTEGAWICLNYT